MLLCGKYGFWGFTEFTLYKEDRDNYVGLIYAAISIVYVLVALALVYRVCKAVDHVEPEHHHYKHAHKESAHQPLLNA